jgi:hypothetical protein
MDSSEPSNSFSLSWSMLWYQAVAVAAMPCSRASVRSAGVGLCVSGQKRHWWPGLTSDLRFFCVLYDGDGAIHEAVHTVLESVKSTGAGGKVWYFPEHWELLATWGLLLIVGSLYTYPCPKPVRRPPRM